MFPGGPGRSFREVPGSAGRAPQEAPGGPWPRESTGRAWEPREASEPRRGLGRLARPSGSCFSAAWASAGGPGPANYTMCYLLGTPAR